MRVLLDTNLLARSAQPLHPQHGLAVISVSLLRARGDAIFLLPQTSGKSAHDAYLVAGMKVYGVAGTLTFDDKDTIRHRGITLLTPARLDQGGAPSS